MSIRSGNHSARRATLRRALQAAALAACLVTTACSKELPAEEFCDFAQETANACIDEWNAIYQKVGSDAVGCPETLERFRSVSAASWVAARTYQERKAIDMVHERFLRLSEVSLKPNTAYTAWMNCERVRELLE